MYLEVGLKQPSKSKEAALQKAKDLLAAAREKLDLLKAEEAEKAQVVQEAHEGWRQLMSSLAAWKTSSDLKCTRIIGQSSTVLSAGINF